MQYKIRFKPRALKDAQKIPKKDLERIFEKIEELKNNLAGDVKRLTNFSGSLSFCGVILSTHF